MSASAPPSGRVANKVALVTGAASGIGRATALLLAEQGALVCCADLNLAGVEATAKATSGWVVALDVTSEPAWEAALAQVVQRCGRLDILVNCAGIAAGCPIVDQSLEEWRRVMAVNLESVLLGTKHAIRVMRQHGQTGSIINVSSISGMKAQPGAAAYCTSKAAILMLTKTAALECVRNGDRIRINAVSPSGVKTPMWKTMPFFQELMAQEGGEEEAFAAMLRSAPHGQWAVPKDIAQAILYLASEESQYVTGSNLVIDNGDTA